jgi:hypothetical protein
MRAATVVRAALGVACVAAPGRVLEVVGAEDPADRRMRVIAQVLGARLLAQATADVVWGRRIRGLDVAVDLTHAASMVAAAQRWPAHRRSALASGAVATSTAVLDLVGGRAGGDG